MRSLSDQFIDRLHTDPRFIARFTERVGPRAVEHILSSTSPGGIGKDGAPNAAGAHGVTTTRTKSQLKIVAEINDELLSEL
jgi:hypothetical protein